MKKLLIAVAAVLVTAASYAQGTVNFNTRFAAANVNAPVVLSTDLNVGPGPSYSAGLYLVANGSETLILDSVTPFRDGTATPAFAKYIVGKEVTLPVAAGPVTLRIKAWETAAGSYEASIAKGQSETFVIQTLGTPPGAPADLPSSLQGFTIVVPEPSTIALGVLGAAALLLRRRK